MDDISGFGAATGAGLDALKAKLNLDVEDCGPVGGNRLGGGICSSEVDPTLLVSSTCRSFEGRKGLSLSVALAS